MKLPIVRPLLPTLDDIEYELRDILSSGKLTNFGKYSKKLEAELATYTGAQYALCVSNATTGLVLALSTLPENSEVIVPSFTFLPTVQAVTWNSLKPVFADVDSHTYNIDTSKVKELITDNTSAILAVNAFGNPCEIDCLDKISAERGLRVFYDSAHALGGKYNNISLGNNGVAEIFSLSATKLLPSGEGGIITTSSKELYDNMLDRRNYGFKYGSYDCDNRGLNGKITEFSAILALSGLETLDKRVARRNHIAKYYIDKLSDIPGLEFQQIKPRNKSTYKDFVITLNPETSGIEKSIFMREMSNAGVEVASYFSPSIHQMSYYRNPNRRALINTEHVEASIVSLPIYCDMSEPEAEYVVQSVRKVLWG